MNTHHPQRSELADLGPYRKIFVRMWRGGSFKRLSPIPPCGQGLWLYLLTGEFTTSLPGVVRAGEMAMAEALAWPIEAYREAFREAFCEGLVEANWEVRLVWCKNALQYNRPQSPNVVKAWWKAYCILPECNLKILIGKEVVSFLRGFGKGFREAFPFTIPEGFPYTEAETETEVLDAAPKPRRRSGKKSPGRKRPMPRSPGQRALTLLQLMWKRERKVAPAISWGKAGKLFKGLAEQMPVEELYALVIEGVRNPPRKAGEEVPPGPGQLVGFANEIKGRREYRNTVAEVRENLSAIESDVDQFVRSGDA